jgi:hypothetical protein
MRYTTIAAGILVAALTGAAHAQSTTGDALKNKPGSVGLQDTQANSKQSGRQSTGTAPKTSNKVRPTPGVDPAPLGSTANRAGRDKASPTDTSGHGNAATDSRRTTNGKDTTGDSHMTR